MASTSIRTRVRSFIPNGASIAYKTTNISVCVLFARNDSGVSSWLERFKERGRVSSSPMTATATPVSAAAEQEHYHNDNQDQFHGISPLMATALFVAHLGIQRRLQSIVPDKRATPQTYAAGCEQFRSLLPKFKRAMRLGNNHAHRGAGVQRAIVWQIAAAWPLTSV
jgi:hypothetical protein